MAKYILFVEILFKMNNQLSTLNAPSMHSSIAMSMMPNESIDNSKAILAKENHPSLERPVETLVLFRNIKDDQRYKIRESRSKME